MCDGASHHRLEVQTSSPWSRPIMSLSLLVLLALAMLIITAKLCGAISGKLGLPIVLGELIAGVILGPSFLNLWQMTWFTSVAQSQSLVPLLKILAEIGVVLLMFVAGLETDINMMRRSVAPAFWAATGGVILPM